MHHRASRRRSPMPRTAPHSIGRTSTMSVPCAASQTQRRALLQLVSGMYAQIQLVPVGPTRLLRVPANTLVFGAEGPRVVTVTRDRKVRYQEVQLGRDLGTEVEILDGLRGDEELITNPMDSLKEGASVQIAAAARQ